MTPIPKLTDEEIAPITIAQWGQGAILAANQAYARAIESAVHAKVAEWIKGQEPQDKKRERDITKVYDALHKDKLGAHWLWCVIEQIAAGIPETEAMAQFGYYEPVKPAPVAPPGYAIVPVEPDGREMMDRWNGEGWRKECDDTDDLLVHLGLDPKECRTTGGWINLPRIKAMLAAAPQAPANDTSK